MNRSLTIGLALAVSLLLSGCGASEPTREDVAEQPPVPRQTIVFDMGHGEVFGPEDGSELGQSQAVERMRSAGFDVVVNPDTIDATDLANASGLVIAGPMRPLLQEEYGAINDFLQRGGTVLLTIHVPFPVMPVPAHWGLPVTPFVMLSESPVAPDGGDASVFVADGVKPGELTAGVDELLIVSGWPIGTASESADLIVRSGPDTWIDANENGTREESETAAFGVVGAAAVGRGSVVVVGDDAVFANAALGQADNAALLDNILRLMSKALES